MKRTWRELQETATDRKTRRELVESLRSTGVYEVEEET